MKQNKILHIVYIDGIQVSIIECGDYFKSYTVEVKNRDEIGFLQTYKHDYQAFEMFNAIYSVLRLKRD